MSGDGLREGRIILGKGKKRKALRGPAQELTSRGRFCAFIWRLWTIENGMGSRRKKKNPGIPSKTYKAFGERRIRRHSYLARRVSGNGGKIKVSTLIDDRGFPFFNRLLEDKGFTRRCPN